MPSSGSGECRVGRCDPVRVAHPIVRWCGQPTSPPARSPSRYVTPIASSPPATLRRTARRTGADPSRALTDPVIARATATATTVTHAAGAITTPSSGTDAPTTKARKLAPAACHGLVRSSGSNPSSTSACARSASFAVSCSATCLASAGSMPLAWYSPASSSSSSSGVSASSRRSLSSTARSVSRWVDTETYSPAAIDMAPAIMPIRPLRMIEPRLSVAPATPSTIAAVDTIPSLAPSTPARNQFNRPASPESCGSSCCGWAGAGAGSLTGSRFAPQGTLMPPPPGSPRRLANPTRGAGNCADDSLGKPRSCHQLGGLTCGFPASQGCPSARRTPAGRCQGEAIGDDGSGPVGCGPVGSGWIGPGLGNGVPGSGVPGPTGDGSGVGGGSSGTGGRSGRSGSGSVGTGGPCGSVGSGSGKGFGCGGSGIVMSVLPAPCVAAWRQRRPTRSVPGERPHTTTKVSPAQAGPGVSTPKPGVPTGRVHGPTSRPTRPGRINRTAGGANEHTGPFRPRAVAAAAIGARGAAAGTLDPRPVHRTGCRRPGPAGCARPAGRPSTGRTRTRTHARHADQETLSGRSGVGGAGRRRRRADLSPGLRGAELRSGAGPVLRLRRNAPARCGDAVRRDRRRADRRTTGHRADPAIALAGSAPPHTDLIQGAPPTTKGRAMTQPNDPEPVTEEDSPSARQALDSEEGVGVGATAEPDTFEPEETSQ